MRAIFSTLHPDNLPETGNRQYENQADANPTRRDGVDCTMMRRQKTCAVIFFRQMKCNRFPVRRNIGKRARRVELTAE
jgi:hypothetical protein